MRQKLLIAATLGATTLGASLIADLPEARAQSSTNGAIVGTVTDQATGEKLAGVTVTVSSPALGQGGVQSAITDENGQYSITQLPPGEYVVMFYYLQITTQRAGITVGVGKTAPVYQKIDQGKAAGTVIKVVDSAPTIDPTSTNQGITIDKNYLKHIPVPGRTFEAALGAAAGSQNDGLGVSFSGSSSLENQYYVDGVNTTGLTFGTVGTPVINDFIEEIEVITGGYNAEYGRATGGVVNVVTKSGSNEFKGSVFGYFRPGELTAPAEITPANAASIDFNSNIAYIADFGFEIGGPIIKDKLWFFAGFVPQFRKTDITRTTKRQTDCRKLQPDGTLSTPLDATCSLEDSRLVSRGGFADGVPDVDPATGFFITENLDEEIRSQTTQAYSILSKINYALNPENQGQLSFQGVPGRSVSPGLSGPAASGSIINSLTTDLSLKWTSKLNNNKTEIEAVVGWHRDHVNNDEAYTPQLQDQPLQVLANGSLGVWGPGFGESPTTQAGCIDGAPGPDGNPNPTGDKYPFLNNNCPMNTRAYVIGGPGSRLRDTEQRQSARLSITQRVKAAGNHEIKAGIDAENNISDKVRAYSGGAFVQNFVGNGVVVVNRWAQLLGPNSSTPFTGRYDNLCRTPDPEGTGAMGGTLTFTCDYISGRAGDPGTLIQGNTFNWSVYLRDSWQIQPNLTLNAGLRYEEQRLRYADFLQNTTDSLTGNALGKNAMTMTGMLAPRVGLLYDWTKEGRSKVYGHWGRFYESIPMDINDRSFGGEVNFRQQFAASGNNCGMPDMRIGSVDGANCLTNPMAVGNSEQLIGASGVLIAPGIKPQYMDETILGMEYEILDDLKLGVAYKNRRMGRVIEDVSTDGANTYIIANPGEWDQAEETKLQDRINRTDDMREKARLENQLELFKGIRVFDKPRRDFNSLEFTLTRRFSKKLYVQGSYTYSKTEGNYPGLISYDNGQVDPNISSQYDLVELLANRIGPLPQDRPHYIKLDGYYTFDFKKKGNLTVGARLRALSGIPTNALGAHYLYGANESFLLPRGQLGRTDFDHGLDMHFGYGKQLNKNMKIEFFVDLFNMYNRQGQFGIDDTYAPSVKLTGPNAASGTQQNANPISGGTYEDLVFLKTIDQDGNETPVPVGTNPNFRNTTARYTPGYARLGVRLSF